jgi:hypothetical protein
VEAAFIYVENETYINMQRKVFAVLVGTLRFTATGAPPAARRIEIFTFRIK